MSLDANNTCDNCNVRVPKYRPKLICSECKVYKHYRCQKLSKNDAINIIHDSNIVWTCYDCLISSLPVNACAIVKNRGVADRSPQVKFKCGCCGGYSCKLQNLVSCFWCQELCHKKCINGDLGCNNCCTELIPGFHVHNYELLGNTRCDNNRGGPWVW